jgi:hypothetical protein
VHPDRLEELPPGLIEAVLGGVAQDGPGAGLRREAKRNLPFLDVSPGDVQRGVGLASASLDYHDRVRRCGRAEGALDRLDEVLGLGLVGVEQTHDGSARTVDLPNAVVKPLAEYLLAHPPGPSGLIFHRNGQPIARKYFGRVWARALRDAGLDKHVRVGWLRHSGASLAYAATHDLKATAERLGHTSTRMVDTVYVKLYQDADPRVADAIDELVRALIVRETDH